MYVVIQIGSTQYKVDEKDEILVPHLKMEEGKNYKIEKVLLCVDEEQKKVMIGTPYLDQVKVEGRVMNHEKGEKVLVFKMKPKKHYKRKAGFRPLYTRLKILKISVMSGTAKESPKVEQEMSATSKETASTEKPKKAKTTASKTTKKGAKPKGEGKAPRKSKKSE